MDISLRKFKWTKSQTFNIDFCIKKWIFTQRNTIAHREGQTRSLQLSIRNTNKSLTLYLTEGGPSTKDWRNNLAHFFWIAKRDLCLRIHCEQWNRDEDESENNYWVPSAEDFVSYIVLPTKHDKTNAWGVVFTFSDHVAIIPNTMPPTRTSSDTHKLATRQLTLTGKPVPSRPRTHHHHQRRNRRNQRWSVYAQTPSSPSNVHSKNWSSRRRRPLNTGRTSILQGRRRRLRVSPSFSSLPQIGINPPPTGIGT